MKKINFLFMALAAMALTFTSCEKSDDKGNDDSSTTSKLLEFAFTGTVSSYSSTHDITSTYDSNIFDVTLDTLENTALIVMNDIRFSDRMPSGFTMNLEDVPVVKTDGEWVIAADSIVPSIAGKPYNNYLITDFEGKFDAKNMEVSFDCSGCNIMFSTKGNIVDPDLVSTFECLSSTLGQSGIPYCDSLQVEVVANMTKGTATLNFKDVKLAAMMPAKTFSADVTATFEDGVVTIPTTTVVPTMEGTPASSYTLVNLSGTIRETFTVLDLTFTTMGCAVTVSTVSGN